ncbi:MAG: AAA family ATPase, partial [Myxococcota bacterium]
MERPPSRIADYVVGSELGRGASGVVYSAHRNGRAYAIKLLASTSASARLQFRREAAAVARLRHPGLVQVVELAEQEGQLYLVMDLASGENLATQIAASALSDEQAAHIGAQLADALAEVHRHSLVHRDVKPENVVLDASGVARLLDFGLVGQALETGSVGTLAYAPPEQLGIMARPVGPAGDLYALGATLFECVTGHPPRDPSNTSRFLHQMATEPAPSVAWVRPQTRPAFAAILDRLLKTDPDDRYQSAERLAEDLRHLDRLDERLRDGDVDVLSTQHPAVSVRFPLVGRSAEQAAIAHAWGAAKVGDVAFLRILGEAGSGKTRLATEFSSRMQAEGVLVLRCKCQQVERTPFAAVREAADHLAEQLMALPSDSRDRIVARVNQAVGAHTMLLDGVSPALAELLGTKEATETIEPTGERERFFRAIAHVFAAVASEATPVVWIVDDLQWLDPDSSQVFAYLCGSPELRHLLVLALARPHDGASPPATMDIAGLRAAPDITLAPLTLAQVTQLTQGQLGGRPLPVEIDQKIAQATRGNPFAIGEYIRALLHSGSLQVTEGGWALRAEDLDALGLPDDVIALVLRRVDALERGPVDVLHAAAILGRPVSPPFLTAVVDRDAVEVLGHCDQLVADGFLERGTDGSLTFHHDRIREAVATRLDATAARGLNQAVADVLHTQGATSPRQIYALARHLAAGMVQRDPAAVLHANLAAGTCALEEHAYLLAFQALTVAHELANDGVELSAPDRVTLLVALGRAAAMTGNLDVAISSLSGAQDLATSKEQAFELQYLMTLTLASQGRNDDALAALYRSFEIAGRPFPRSLPAQAVGLLWAALTGMVTYGLGLGSPVDGEDLRSRLVTSRLHYAGSMLALFDGDTFLMVQFIVRDFLNVQRLRACPEKAIATTVYGAVLGTLQLTPLMRHFTSAGVAMAQDLADPAAVAVCTAYQGCGHKWAGQLDRGTELQLQALPMLVQYVPGSWYTAMMICEQAYSYQHAGNAAAAHAHIQAMLPDLERTNNRMFVYNTLAVDYAARRVLGDRGGAAALWSSLEQDFEGLADTGYAQLARVQASFEDFLDRRETGPEVQAMIDAFADTLGEDYYSAYARILYGYAYLDRADLSQGAERDAAIRRLRRHLWSTLPRALAPVFRVHLIIWRAGIDRLHGRTARAEARLRKAEDLIRQTTSAWATYRISLERAALAAGHASGTRHAKMALDIATTQGWRQKAQSVRQRFGLGATSGRTRSPARTTLSAPGSTDRHRRFADALLQVSLASVSSLAPDAHARQTLDAVTRTFGAERARFYLLDETTGTLGLLASSGSGADTVSQTVLDRVIATNEPFVSVDSGDGDGVSGASIQAHGLQSIMAAPLRFQDRVIGVLYLDNRLAKGVFSEDDVELLLGLGAHIAIGVQTARTAQVELERAELERDLELAAAVQ